MIKRKGFLCVLLIASLNGGIIDDKDDFKPTYNSLPIYGWMFFSFAKSEQANFSDLKLSKFQTKARKTLDLFALYCVAKNNQPKIAFQANAKK